MKTFLSVMLAFLLQTTLLPEARSQQVSDLSGLVDVSKDWFEGFRKNLGEHEFSYAIYSYNVSTSLLARCKEGENTIEWATAVVPEDFGKEEAGFLWLAAIDLTTEKHSFDLFFNGKKRFTIPTSQKKRWQVTGRDGGTLSFMAIETDHNGDALGYMWLTVPAAWLEKGSSQRIRITGRPDGSNTWVIVYQEPGALSYLHHFMEYDVMMGLEIREKGRSPHAVVEAPLRYADKMLFYRSGTRKGSVLLQKKDSSAAASFALPLPPKKKSIEIRDSIAPLFLFSPASFTKVSTFLLPEGILINEGEKKGSTLTITARRTYAPAAAKSILTLSRSPVSRGTILLMNSSHQDIAWMDSPEKCILARDTMIITPLLELVRQVKDYHFDIEDALMIKEYTGRHPEKKTLIGDLLRDGTLSCGATYTQPYEEMYSGEALARQFYFGAKWLKDEFGYRATVYWNEDVPGRTLQMMQLMRKAGVQYLMLSRFEKGLYHWYSPDGSYVTVFSPGHYGAAFARLEKTFTPAAQYIAENAMEWEKLYPAGSETPVVPLLCDRDMSPAIDHSGLVSRWNNLDRRMDEEGKIHPVTLPRMQMVTAPAFFEMLEKEKPLIREVRGERPDVWLYIHGPAHQKALKASREAGILLTQAEKFATALALTDSSFKNYPAERLRSAWEAKIYPDHGWGGKHGDITDALFRRKFEFAKEEAAAVLECTLHDLAARIRTKKEAGRPLVVFNSMDNIRDDPVSAGVTFDRPGTFSVVLTDGTGDTIPIQLTGISRYPDGSVKSATLHFIARQVPPAGYRIWYMTPSPDKPEDHTPAFRKHYENGYYAVTFGNGGLSSVYDKELDKELIDSGKFKAGEVFTMHSEGFGAGEFADIQKPDMEGFDRTGNYQTLWITEESGDVFTTFSYRQQIRNAVVEQKIKIYHRLKRIDFETSLLNWEGVLYREYRMALPLKMSGGKVAYEVPFGVVEVGKDELAGAAGERYTTPCREMHPRGIGNWIAAGDDAFGVTLSSGVAVADWVDPTADPVSYPVLQPVLLASRRSCHWEGNEYLQTGDHHFLFSLTSHAPGRQHGMLQGRGANEVLRAVWADNSYKETPLPESMSFFSTGDPDIFISTVKKAEDSDEVVIRLVNMSTTGKKVTLHCFRTPQDARLTTLIEEDLQPLPVTGKEVTVELGPRAIETLKMR